ELQQFINTNIVRLYGAPYGVQNGWALVGMTYGVFPVMGRNKVPARHPQNLAVHFFHECDHIGTEASDVVGGHKRDSAHAKAALTLTNNFKPRAGGIDVRIEFEVNGFAVFGGRDSLGDGLSIAPAHSDRYFHTTS